MSSWVSSCTTFLWWLLAGHLNAERNPTSRILNDAQPSISRHPRATPWELAPHATTWHDVPADDLVALLEAVSSGTPPEDPTLNPTQHLRVSCVLATSSLQSMLVNWIYSLVMYGRSTEYLVAVLDDESVAMCTRLNLPCWDARSVLSTSLDIEGSHVHNHTAQGSGYNKLVHAKPSLGMGVPGWCTAVATITCYTQQPTQCMSYSSMDTTCTLATSMLFLYAMCGHHLMRCSTRVMLMLPSCAKYGRHRYVASCVCCTPATCTINTPSMQGIDNVINSGHAVIRNNEQTRAMYAAYAGGQEHRHKYTGDQGWLNNGPGLRTHVYDVCDDAQACDDIHARGMAAVAPYSEQGGPWNPCVEEADGSPIAVCRPWQVAIHFICMVGRETKLQAMRNMGLLLVTEEGEVEGPSSPLPCLGLARLHDYSSE